MRAVRVHDNGGPDVLRVDEIDVPEPGPGEVRVRIDAAGLNFIDTYHREGLYPLDLPATLGVDAAGTVDAVGDGVRDVAPGDRVAYAGQRGAYAEYAVVPADAVVPVPDGLDLQAAAAVLLQGMTAHYLSHTTYPLDEGDTCLVYAAAGGVGHLLVQFAKQRGARVLATVSTGEKEDLARQDGADEVIRYRDVDLVTTVRELTDGHGVDVVYDSVGADTFDQSLDCLRPRGYLVLYGQSSGPVDPVDPQTLNQKGSLFLTRPTLAHYTARREELLWRADDLLGGIASGELSHRIDRSFPLDEAAEAHRYIEAGRTRGKVLLVP
jgi:NADPH:quinone reductase